MVNLFCTICKTKNTYDKQLIEYYINYNYYYENIDTLTINLNDGSFWIHCREHRSFTLENDREM